MAGVLGKRGGTQGRRLCVGGGGDQVFAATSQGPPRAARSWGRHGRFFHRAWKGGGSSDTLISDCKLPELRWDEALPCWAPACSAPLRRPWERDTARGSGRAGLWARAPACPPPGSWPERERRRQADGAGDREIRASGRGSHGRGPGRQPGGSTVHPGTERGQPQPWPLREVVGVQLTPGALQRGQGSTWAAGPCGRPAGGRFTPVHQRHLQRAVGVAPAPLERAADLAGSLNSGSERIFT